MYSSIKRLFESEGVKAAEQKLVRTFEQKKTKLTDISLRGVWESIVGPVHETLHFLKNKGGYYPFNDKRAQEADVRVSSMSNIVGVLLHNEMIDEYNAVPKISPMLVEEFTSNLKDEQIAGFQAMNTGDEIEEAEDYPEYGTSDKYVTTGQKKKRGGIVHVTEEALIFDQTGRLKEHVRGLMQWMAMQKEKNVVSGVVGGHQCYYPSGVATSLYGGSPYLVTNNLLVDWTDIEKAENDGLGAMTAENGEPIDNNMPNKVLLVPIALKYTGKRIVNATEAVYGADSDTIKMIGKNPVSDENITVVSSRYVYTYTSSDTTWFYGNPKRQFRYKSIYPLQTFTLPPNNMLEFTRDIKFSYKVREWGWVFCIDTKYFVKNTA